jgi:hypothetical protein
MTSTIEVDFPKKLFDIFDTFTRDTTGSQLLFYEIIPPQCVYRRLGGFLPFLHFEQKSLKRCVDFLILNNCVLFYQELFQLTFSHRHSTIIESLLPEYWIPVGFYPKSCVGELSWFKFP